MLVKGGNSEVVHRLLDLKADVNDQSFDWPRRTKALRVLCMLIVLQHRCGNVNTMTTQVYHAEGATPLMFRSDLLRNLLYVVPLILLASS